ncbi:MAG: acyclic terpene utilization AtuA family protein, partial [Cohaesibacteraceae bacterium]
ATPLWVSAHLLFDNSDPNFLLVPGGYLDVTNAKYAAIGDGSVRVEGSTWETAPYTVKLEGAYNSGFQTVSMVMVRERRYVENIESWVQDIATKCRAKVIDRLQLAEDEFSIELRIIGMNSVLGDLEVDASPPREVGVMGIVTAKTAKLAEEIGKTLNPYLLHHPLTEEEPMPTFAFPFSPAELARGATYAFCLHHVMPLSDPMDAFRLETRDFARA